MDLGKKLLAGLFSDSAGYRESLEDDGFPGLVAQCLRVFELSERELADKLHVSRTTVLRWVRGTNLPHPVMRREIARWMRKRALRCGQLTAKEYDQIREAIQRSGAPSLSALIFALRLQEEEARQRDASAEP